MDDVAREARVSKGGLYRHFPSKDELFLTVAIQETRAFEQRLHEVASAHASASGFTSARACMADLVRYAKEERDRFTVALRGVAAHYSANAACPLFAEYQGAVHSLLGVATATLVRGQRDGSVRCDIPAEQLAFNVWGALLGVIALEETGAQYQQRVFEMGGAPNLSTDFVDLFLAGIRPTAVPEPG